MKEIVSNRSLLILGLAESISNIGSWITMMALFALLIFRGEGGVAASSGIMLAGLGPLLVAGPVAGWLSDRFDRRRLMIASQLLSAIPVAVLLFIQDGVAVYLLIALQSLTFSVMMPARQAAIPSLVGESQLTQANAFLQQLSSFIKVGAPMIGGGLVAALGPTQGLILDLLSFVVAAGVLCFLPALPPARAAAASSDQENTVVNDSTWWALRTSADLQLLFTSIFIGIIVVMGFDVLGPVYVRDILAGGEQFFGLLIGLVGFGSLLAAIWLMVRGSDNAWRDLAVGILLLSALPLTLYLGTFLSTSVARQLALAGGVIGGMGNGLVVVQISTLLQRLSPAAMLGRLGGLLQSTIVAGQLITILTAPLIVPAWLSMAEYLGGSLVVLWLVALLIPLRRRQRGSTPRGVPRSATGPT